MANGVATIVNTSTPRVINLTWVLIHPKKDAVRVPSASALSSRVTSTSVGPCSLIGGSPVGDAWVL